MILVHILELFATPVLSETLPGKMIMYLGGIPVAPVFMIIMGYFSYSMYISEKNLISRGFFLFITAMLLNLGLNMNLIFSTATGKLDANLFPYIFGVDILHFAGLSLILIALSAKLLERSYVATIILIVLIPLLGSILLSGFHPRGSLQYILSFVYGCSEWSYFPLLPWLSYPLIGFTFAKFQNSARAITIRSKESRLTLTVLFIVFVLASFNYVMRVSNDLPEYYHHSIAFLLCSVIFIAGYAFVLDDLVRRINHTHNALFNYIKWLGKNVTVLFVVQWLIIGNIATAVYKSISSPYWITLSFILILAASGLLAFVFLKLRSKIAKAF